MSPARLSLELSRTLDATPSEVFEAWTRPERIKLWFAPGAMTVPECEVDLREGGAWRVAMQEPGGPKLVTSGVFKEIVPNQRLVFTWGWDGPEREETLVTVELTPRGTARTELRLTHQRFSSPGARKQHLAGWEGCLQKLSELFNPPKGTRRKS